MITSIFPITNISIPNKNLFTLLNIYRFHWWNKKDLLNPIILVENYNYNWYMMLDDENIENYKVTTTQEALNCYKQQKTYYEESL